MSSSSRNSQEQNTIDNRFTNQVDNLRFILYLLIEPPVKLEIDDNEVKITHEKDKNCTNMRRKEIQQYTDYLNQSKLNRKGKTKGIMIYGV